MLKLFYSPGVCSLSPHIALREAGLPFSLEKVDLATKHTDQGTNYKTINPLGYVPALQLETGDVLFEGPAIVQYIADQAPEKKLAPTAGTLDRYRLQEMLNVITSEIHKGFIPLFNPRINDESKDALRKRLVQRISYFDSRLASRPYLMGENFSVADPYLFVTMTWSRGAKVDLSTFPNIAAFMERMLERPAVRAAVDAEGLKI